ncbi:hypothetical protein HHUSO_G35554 [Huso huso]|uniref:Uncharacterized protein n=1 Tax=Huso huso TaxID=61971 RepID=A0ABR0Y3B4_HUSHU
MREILGSLLPAGSPQPSSPALHQLGLREPSVYQRPQKQFTDSNMSPDFQNHIRRKRSEVFDKFINRKKNTGLKAHMISEEKEEHLRNVTKACKVYI